MKIFYFSILCVSMALLSCHGTQKMSNGPRIVNMFDGKTLDGWVFDSTYWHVDNGIMVGTITPETIIKRNTFIIYQNEQPEDFELLVEFRVSAAGNSGINYRSVLLEDAKYSLKGYQCDIDGQNRYTGQNYEERGRTFLAHRGERVVLEQGQKPKVIDSLGSREFLLSKIKKDDWNEARVLAVGNNIKHYINGVLMAEVTDNDATRTTKGYIGVQVHVGPPMKIEYRNFRLKTLK